jgi:hypothetical protein
VTAAVVGLSAFLLFFVQLLLGKRLLPWFGGGAAVWTTCLVFYQAALLAGYAWAHFVTRLEPRRQRDSQLLLLAAALLVLAWHGSSWPSPLTPHAPTGWLERPVAGILALLASTIGLPFVALAATSPLVQAWFVRLHPGASPYALFALSNAGSLAGLLSYPLVLERVLDLDRQGWLWAWLFTAFAIGTAWLAIAVGRNPGGVRAHATPRTWPPPVTGTALAEASPSSASTVPLRERETAEPDAPVWIALAFVPSLALAAVTSQITQEIAPLPLLWMLPLALYLLSFVLAFAWPDRGAAAAPWALSAAAALALVGLDRALELGAVARIALWLLVLLVYALAGHGELARRRPSVSGLTRYYLAIASGGALGGLFAAVIAPSLFDGYWELHLALVLGPATLAWARAANPAPAAADTDAPARRQRWALAAVGLVVLAAVLIADVVRDRESLVHERRGFHGVLRILREDAGEPDEHLRLVHGRISHGLQLTATPRRAEPTTYYGAESGVGLAIQRHPKRLAGRPMHVGVVGLGVGTLAAWSRAGDRYRFYELDPAVVRLSEGAAPLFTFLRDARGETLVTLGDGRLALDAEGPQGYDVLALDAFSSDAVPVHLLTLEAFRVYLRHLADGGVLAVHVTNRHLDLKPVVRGAARALRLHAAHVPAADRGLAWGCDWMLLARERSTLGDEALSAATLPPLPRSGEVVWTDGWSDLLAVLKR